MSIMSFSPCIAVPIGELHLLEPDLLDDPHQKRVHVVPEAGGHLMIGDG